MHPDKPQSTREYPDRQLRRFFAAPEQFQRDEVVLSSAETHHLIRVLRLPLGERVEVSDGCGRIFAAEISLLEPDAARLRILSELNSSLESTLQITLGLALVRSETFDLVVRQVTEMGILRLIPFHSARTLVKPEGWKQTRHSRWLRLSQEALKSSQRRVLPEIGAPVEFFQVLEGSEELKVLFWENQRELDYKVNLASEPRPRSVRALIGPEGGFTTPEVAAARNAGFLLSGLGPRRLRVETAAMAAVTVLQYLWGDLGT
jgi:16S rRNA (uracil1498-N3)-methyltransferase